MNFHRIKNIEKNETKVKSNRLGRLKHLIKNKSRSFLGGCLGGSCVHVYCTLAVTVLYSLYGISDVS